VLVRSQLVKQITAPIENTLYMNRAFLITTSCAQFA
jgi:hypothetical protein